MLTNNTIQLLLSAHLIADIFILSWLISGLLVGGKMALNAQKKGAYGYDDSSSAEGYIDNLTVILNKIEEIWVVNGWNSSELSFLNVASHVVAGDPNDTQLTSYRDALTTLANARSNLTTVDLSELMTYAEATTNDWYLSQEELEHLNETGYNEVSALIFGDL